MSRHTPSSYPRLRQCLGSAALPWALEEHEGTRRGTELHSFAEAIIAGTTREQALAAVPPEWRADAEELDTTPFELLRGAMVEVGLAWSPSTGACRVLGQRMTREQARAACAPGEVPMVVDVLGWEDEGRLFLLDWKYARGEDLAPAAEHWQLLTYTAVAMVALKAESARCLLAKWRGLRWRWDPAEVDLLDARVHLEQVRAMLERAETVRERFLSTGELPPLARGPWCQWCPSQRFCPAVVAPLIAFAQGNPVLAVSREVAELTPESAGAALVLAKELRRLLDRAISDLNSLARQTPLVLPDGREYAPQDRPRLDAEAAHTALARVFGQEFADKACPMQRVGSLSESVRAAVREVLAPARKELLAQGRVPKERATLRAMLEEVRGVLDAAGALEAKTQSHPKESGHEPEEEP